MCGRAYPAPCGGDDAILVCASGAKVSSQHDRVVATALLMDTPLYE
jgi:hypothetical protein